jgi:hypothetical protein
MPPPLPNAVTFWIKAFIPDPPLCPLHVFPAPGTSAGKSMVIIPDTIPLTPIPTTRAFLGDSRGFSSDVNASARIHSLVEFTNLNTR